MKKNNEINFLATKVFYDTWEATQSGNYKLIEQMGSSRSSKTWSDFQVIFLDLYENPMTICTVLRDTQKSCRDIIEVDWIKWLSDPMGRKSQLERKEINIQEFDVYIKEENLTFPVFSQILRKNGPKYWLQYKRSVLAGREQGRT